jgi:hypothetical protein
MDADVHRMTVRELRVKDPDGIAEFKRPVEDALQKLTEGKYLLGG